MSIILILAILAVVSVAAVLLIGIISMMRGGEFNKRYGNKLMVARVSLQALSLLLLMTLWALSTK